MDLTRTNANRITNSRSTYLPNISSSQGMSYAQRYEHMTKIANYNQMNEAQIWKQYEKLRICLKELNEQVLHHMEKKATLNLYAKQAPVPPSVQASLLVLEQQKKTNQSRLMIFVNEAASLEQRVQHLTNKTEYLQDINSEIEITEAKIKQITLQNKDMKRKQKLASKDLLSGPNFLERLVIEEQALHYAKKKYDKYDQIYKQAFAKEKQFNEKTAEYQTVLLNRVTQYKEQEDFVVEQLNLQKFQQLQSQKTNLQKYQTVYKRNYLMKLKQLQNLVNSVNRHDQIIQQTQASIKNMRGEIDQISSLVVKNNQNRRRGSISVMQNQGTKSGRRSIILDTSVNTSINNPSLATVRTTKQTQTQASTANDKNKISSIRH